MEKDFSLRNKIDEAKAEYMERRGELDWQWTDEGLPYTIADYHGSVGSVLDFTEDDWRVCKENGWTLDDVCILCDEPWFCQGTDSICSFLGMVMCDWRQRNSKWSCADEEVSKTAILAAVEEFYTWRAELLPKVQKIYADG